MENELDTSAAAETEVVQPEQNDTAPDWDYFDPEEDNEETPETEATEDDGQVADDEPETTEATSEDEAQEGEEEASTTAYFDLPDGTQIEADEAVKGYLRQSDYSRKTEEVAQMRNTYEANSKRIQGITEAFVEHLTALLPNEPDAALAATNPNEYTRQKAVYDASYAKFQEIISVGEQIKEVSGEVSAAEQEQLRNREFRALSAKFPQIANEKGRQSFMVGVNEAATAFGLQQELGQIVDSRVHEALHWANVGLKAHAARQSAKQKAAKAPPVTPNKPARNAPANRNADAMRKLKKSGSIRDAMAIDFD